MEVPSSKADKQADIVINPEELEESAVKDVEDSPIEIMVDDK